MIYERRVSVGSFLKKGEDVKQGDIIEIANEGKKVPGEYGEQDVFLIKLSDGREGNISFNQTTINNLIDGYGKDSINWIGKKVKIEVIRQNVQGKIRAVYYFLHPDTILDEASGEFMIGKKEEKEDLPEEELEF